MQQRTREFGIRIALGAQRSELLGIVLKSGGILVAIGTVGGAFVSLLVARALSQLLFETAPADPIVFGAAILLLAGIGVLACLLPAIRAARLDPRLALSSIECRAQDEPGGLLFFPSWALHRQPS
jgi:putative ABC transport system permease protein